MSDNPFVDEKDYVKAVLDTYVLLPDTPIRTRRDDRYLAITWYRQGIMLFQAKTAMLLATERRTFREADALPLEPIRSLRYHAGCRIMPVLSQVVALDDNRVLSRVAHDDRHHRDRAAHTA